MSLRTSSRPRTSSRTPPLTITEVESRTQGSRPKPRTQKNPRPRPRTVLPRTDTLEAKDRYARGQGQGPRTQAQVLSKKKRSSQKFFKRSPQKNVFQKIFQALHKILTIQKKCCPRAEDRPIFEDLRPRGQGQGLQNLSSRTSSRRRTSSRTPPLDNKFTKNLPKIQN